MRAWIQELIHRWLGPTRYHQQANEVQSRNLRAHVLAQRLEVIRRGK